jgi:hypothetical protein
MSPIERWGPATWTLFHVLAEKVSADAYPTLRGALFSWVYRICSGLPCPDCAAHAKEFLSKLDPQKLLTKDDFRNTLYIFHNVVNRRKGKPVFPVAGLARYQYMPIAQICNTFAQTYHTKGNMSMLSESFYRQILLDQFRPWMMMHIKHFQTPVHNFVANLPRDEEPPLAEKPPMAEEPITEEPPLSNAP